MSSTPLCVCACVCANGVRARVVCKRFMCGCVMVYVNLCTNACVCVCRKCPDQQDAQAAVRAGMCRCVMSSLSGKSANLCRCVFVCVYGCVLEREREKS